MVKDGVGIVAFQRPRAMQIPFRISCDGGLDNKAELYEYVPHSHPFHVVLTFGFVIII
jgi:hypothetical protein